MQLSTSLVFGSAVSRMHEGDLMRQANTAGLQSKVEKHCYLFCLFAAKGGFLLSESNHMIRCLTYLSKLTRKSLMTFDQCTHIKTLSVIGFFF